MERLRNFYIRRDSTYLLEFCKDNNIELSKDYSNEKINNKAVIEGKCVNKNCGKLFSRKFVTIINFGAYCKDCTAKIRKENVENTCLEKYGVTNPNKNREIREKIEKTNIEKYGTKYTLQNKEVIEKMKQTCLKNHGVEYAQQSSKIREKSKKTCLKNHGVEYPQQKSEIRDKSKQTCLENYGVENPSQSEEVKEKMKKTFLINYGVEHPFQNEEIKEKNKKNCLIKYGVENNLQREEIRDKIKQTCLQNNGVENPFYSKEIQEKAKKIILEKYGVENVFQSEKIKEKSKQTCLIKYGVEYCQQNSEVSEKTSKNAYKSKEYTFPSGKIIRVQGYEPYGIDELINTEKINEDDIITNRSEVPTIWYEDKNGKKRRYFVDILINSQKRCIEVKSTWTMEKKRDCVFEKQQAVKDAGYECEIWVFNGKGEKIECYK